jgi:APA family basic amino acid/polyamine antiporter
MKQHQNSSEITVLRPTLKLFDLIFLGIGSIVGVGIFVVAGITAATTSGPAVVLSFVVAGITSIFIALAYAELASSVGSSSGGAYSYTRLALGPSVGWMIGWILLFEYAIAAAYLAMSWSEYLASILRGMGVDIPYYLQHSIVTGGLIDLPAVLIVLYLGFLLFVGTRKGSRFNLLLVAIKLVTILSFIVVASQHVDVRNWQNFIPFGWWGIMHGAALVFNAFVGFDILASAAGDAENPKKNLPISIVVTLAVSTILYIAVAALLTGIAHYTTLNSAAAITDALIGLHLNWVATFIGTGAILSITTVLFGFLFGFTRVIYALSKDNFLPNAFSKIHQKNGTPYRTVMIAGAVTFILLEIIPLNEAIKLINLGTLGAYIFVCLSVMKLRQSQPNLERRFKLPFNPLIPVLGVMTCIFLMINLSAMTWVCFAGWLLVGLIVHLVFHKKARNTRGLSAK